VDPVGLHPPISELKKNRIFNKSFEGISEKPYALRSKPARTELKEDNDELHSVTLQAPGQFTGIAYRGKYSPYALI
jgi:hypothetical protein